MKQASIQKAFERFLDGQSLKLTSQRSAVFSRAFATHSHFTADTLLGWLREDGGQASRATVYRTLDLLVQGGFLETLDVGSGELLYEHVLGHRHHDHLVCTECGRIDEFQDPGIELLQGEVCQQRGFKMSHHSLRIWGLCRSCAR